MSRAAPAKPPIDVFVVDVDGTLLTPDKVLTDRAVRAVAALREAGVRVALTSGRPPRGIRMLIEPLAITLPLAAFEGAMIVDPELRILEQHVVDANAARQVAALLGERGLDVWVYRGTEWFVRDPCAPHVDRERSTVEFDPKVTDDLSAGLDQAAKIVGVSDDHARMARAEKEVDALDAPISAARSQPYYLDVTHPDGNKGNFIRYLSRRLGVSPERIGTIGDMPNDVEMFEVAGLSIAMGNAEKAVQKQANHVTAANTEEGFARAVEELILTRA